VPWLGFQEGVSRSATAITDQAVLVKKIRFPREALVWAVLISAVLQQLIALTVFAVVLTGAGKLPWRAPWLLPLALALEVGMIYLLGMVLSVLTVWFRDLVQVVGMVLSAWFYLTPVVYSLGMVPERLRAWLVLNPLTTVVELHRAAFFGLAATAVSWKAVAGLAALTSLGCVLATRWFRRATPALADEL